MKYKRNMEHLRPIFHSFLFNLIEMFALINYTSVQPLLVAIAFWSSDSLFMFVSPIWKL